MAEHLSTPPAARFDRVKKVALLPPIIAERIAAGEVIERPASVVKELVENSIDAGASHIWVTLEEGGKSLIEVKDNGAGMSLDDLEICVKRHATSKLRSLDDLERIVTLGFRGEALPSIAAASDLSLISRAFTSPKTHELVVNFASSELKPNPITFGHFLGSEHGTIIRSQGLFSQIPARLKFLRSAGSEVTAVKEWIERLALSHPEIAFTLESNGKKIVDHPAQSETDRVRSVLVDNQDFPIVVFKEGPVRVYWIQGYHAPSTRKLIQVINGRAIRDRLIQQAILGSFKQALLPGQFPALVFFLDLPPGEIDVNVHPTKTEVRLLNPGRVFHEIETLLSSMIAHHGFQGFVPNQAGSQSQSQGIQKSNNHSSESGSSPTPTWPSPSPYLRFSSPTPTWPSTNPSATTFATPMTQSPLPLPASHTPGSALTSEFATHQFRGVLFRTYICLEKAAESGLELVLIDQHAAHERISYERLKARFEKPLKETSKNGPTDQTSGHSTQQLLIPEVTHFDSTDHATITLSLPLLTRMGFDCELFSETALLFRGIPTFWGDHNLKSRLASLVDRLASASGDEEGDQKTKPTDAQKMKIIDGPIFERLAMEACRSSIRAGDQLSEKGALDLINELFECEHPWNCPHGRPTVVRIPEARFEEWFQRRV